MLLPDHSAPLTKAERRRIALMSLVLKPASRKLLKALEDPEATQQRKLNQYLKHNAGTAFGQKHGFASIATVKEYQEQVPVHSYEDLKPYVEKAMAGEPRQLTMEEPNFFIATSGTTGNHKYYPANKSYWKEIYFTRLPTLYYLMQQHPPAMRGRFLSLFGNHYAGQKTEKGVPVGLISAKLVYDKGKRGPFSATDMAMQGLADMSAKYYVNTLLSLHQNISMLFAQIGSTHLILADTLANHTETLLHDLRTGQLQADLTLTPEERALIMKVHKARPKLADALAAEVKAQGGVLTPHIAWPKLEMIFMWLASSAGAYVPLVKQRFPGIGLWEIPYAASEGVFTVSNGEDSPGGRLALGAHFYEFEGVDEEFNGTGTYYQPHELEAGKTYKMIVTTAAGLYRYAMNDLVLVKHMTNGVPSIRFVGKAYLQGPLDRLSEWDLDTAFARAMEKFQVTIPYYTVHFREKGAQLPQNEFYMELPPYMDDAAREELFAYIDEQLCAISKSYGFVRSQGMTQKPKALWLGPGSLVRYRKYMVQRGGAEGQVKPMPITLDPGRLSALEVLGECNLS